MNQENERIKKICQKKYFSIFRKILFSGESIQIFTKEQDEEKFKTNLLLHHPKNLLK